MAADPSIKRTSRVARVIVGLLVVVLVGAAGWWAGRTTLTESPEAHDSGTREIVWAEATETSVGRSLNLSTTVRQPTNVVAVNALSGIVRQVNPGLREQGDVLYVVGDTPVRAVEAELPFWRELSRGAEGDDVLALQELLRDLKYFSLEPNGKYGPATEAAVKRWQKDLDQRQTGAIELGELVAIKQLPTTVEMGEPIKVGWLLTGGEDAVLAPTGDRSFALVVGQHQADLIPFEATVDVEYEDYLWTAHVSEINQNMEGTFDYVLTGLGGGEVCGSECDVLPPDSFISLPSSVNIVPHTEGVGVPAVAVRTATDGSTYVVTKYGDIPVAVRGSGQGIVIVDGIDVGTQVQVTSSEELGGEG